VVGDPSRLRQIVTNLIGNAIKFTQHGDVVLTVEIVTRTDDAATVRFSVSDTGIGIPHQQTEAIFKPFVQADSSVTRKYGGTGLGLAISTNLVALLGGRIWLESEIGKGSTFHFTMPFGLQQTPADTTGRDAQLMRLRDLAVLVVDDNAVHRRIVEATLRRWHMKPVLAENGRAGVAAMQKSQKEGAPFSLVVLDSQMPEADGFSVAVQIRNDPALSATPMLMLTSGGQWEDAARCRTLGIAACLMKPISETDLLEAILAVLVPPSGGPDRLQRVTPHALPANRGPLRILVADDNKVNQLVATRLLEKRGHTVAIAGNGREALAALDEHRFPGFDLILLDVQMPEMDGFQVTGIIRAREQSTGVHLPIIALTAHAMKGDQERCLAAGMDGYLSKPFHVEEVVAAIDRVLMTRGI
jgi:CheY-like chemotaxis protein